MEYTFIDTNQVSERVDAKKHIYPKYPKTTTDQTYYEPAATRIANMRKASGVQLEGIYDFYGDDAKKFSKSNFEKNISEVSVDPCFNNNMLPEEISQVVNDLGFEAQKTVDSKKSSTKEKAERISEAVKTSEIIQKNSSSEE